MTPGSRACTLLLCLLLGACAHRRPADADLRAMSIESAPAEAAQPEAWTKAGAATNGAVRSGGGALAITTLGCLLVPVAVGPCVALIAPITVPAGATIGGVIGGSVTKNTEPAPAELVARMETAAAQRQLVEMLQSRAAQLAGEPATDATPAPASAPPYAMSLRLADLRIQRAKPGRPAPLVLLARVAIQQAGQEAPVWVKDFRVLSKDKRPAEDWAASPDAGPIEQLLEQLADRIATELSPRKS